MFFSLVKTSLDRCGSLYSALFGGMNAKLGSQASHFLTELDIDHVCHKLEQTLLKKSVQKDLRRLFGHEPFLNRFGQMDEMTHSTLITMLRGKSGQKTLAKILKDKSSRRRFFYELGLKIPAVTPQKCGGFKLVSYLPCGAKILSFHDSLPYIPDACQLDLSKLFAPPMKKP